MRTGKVRHGGKCGGRFRVRDGRTVAKGYVYVCPFCTGKVLSNMKTGQINHRSVCNNQFYVKDGEVSKATRMYAHACPVCHTVVWSSRSCGRIFLKHQTSAGKPCKTTTWRVQENKAQKRWGWRDQQRDPARWRTLDACKGRQLPGRWRTVKWRPWGEDPQLFCCPALREHLGRGFGPNVAFETR